MKISYTRYYMTHQDHVWLIRKGIHKSGGVWADFGSGIGAFTLALAELIGKNGIVFSVDKDAEALKKQSVTFAKEFPGQDIRYMVSDFQKNLSFPPLDGIILANSLHFIENKELFLMQLRNYLSENGRLIIVEYNADTGNEWVPHPLSYVTFSKLSMDAGFQNAEFLEKIPSSFLKEIYSAYAVR